MTTSDRELDKVLAGASEPDEELAPLAETARRLETLFAVDVPESRPARALFTTAVGARRRATGWRYLAPAIAVASLLVAVYYAGRTATPGQPLYPVRKALQRADLAPATLDQLDERLGDATRTIVEAEDNIEDRPRRARVLATSALKTLGTAETLLEDLPREEAASSREAIARLETRALAVLLASFEEDDSAIEERADRLDDSDHGSGSGDSGSEDSGSGSDDSGSGSDDSGSGSDDSGPDDSGPDDSGSGSGPDDSSGSGSGGSSSDDSSGSGSGD